MEKLTGYKLSIYQGYVRQGLLNGLPVQEAIEQAQDRISLIPRIDIGDDENPLAKQYMDSQREVECRS